MFDIYLEERFFLREKKDFFEVLYPLARDLALALNRPLPLALALARARARALAAKN